MIVGALGTESGGVFFGLPPIRSTFIPFSLPEITFYKAQNQTRYVKFKMNFFEKTTGEFVGSTSNLLTDTYHNKYTILLISYTLTDLISPPATGYLFRSNINKKEIESEDKSFFIFGNRNNHIYISGKDDSLTIFSLI